MVFLSNQKMNQTVESMYTEVDEYVYYTYIRNGVEYATPDYDFAFNRSTGSVYKVTYQPTEINAPACA